jgi:hypothetical protein
MKDLLDKLTQAWWPGLATHYTRFLTTFLLLHRLAVGTHPPRKPLLLLLLLPIEHVASL